mgnify:CR=1 FL=1
MNYEMVALFNNFDEVVEEISKVEKPAGILVFGPDSRLKAFVHRKILHSSGRIFGKEVCSSEGSSILWTRIERHTTQNGTVIMLDGDTSSQHGERHRIVLGMKNSGMKSVIGIYVKGDRSNESFEDARPVVEKHPPTADGLTMLISVSTTNPSPLT